MKQRTLVERVAALIFKWRMGVDFPCDDGVVNETYRYHARRTIAMVRRHDRKEKKA